MNRRKALALIAGVVAAPLAEQPLAWPEGELIWADIGPTHQKAIKRVWSNGKVIWSSPVRTSKIWTSG